MKRRNAVHLVVWSFLAAAGCSSTSAPALPACGSALASQVALSIGGDTTLDPAADSGCVTFAANLSAVDSVEYLLVPQSVAGTFGESSPFLLGTTTLTAAPAVPQRMIASSSPRLARSEEHTSELQSLAYLVCRLLLEKKKKKQQQ